MTTGEAVKRIKEHQRIHLKKEPCAVKVQEALQMACDVLELLPRLKAENKNCAETIKNQREQLQGCNKKIKRLDDELRTVTENILNEAIPVFCDKYCRYPLECQSQDELDTYCDNCDFIKILNTKKE